MTIQEKPINLTLDTGLTLDKHIIVAIREAQKAGKTTLIALHDTATRFNLDFDFIVSVWKKELHEQMDDLVRTGIQANKEIERLKLANDKRQERLNILMAQYKINYAKAK